MRRTAWLALTLLVLPACAGLDEPDQNVDGGLGPHAVPEAGARDGGALDSGSRDAATDAAIDMPPLADAGVGADRNEYDDTAGLSAFAARMGCFDGTDNDGDGLADCADSSCQQHVPSCCVGQSSTECCSDGTVLALSFMGCAGPLSGCTDASEVATFGSPVPTVRRDDDADAMIPGGQDSDSGALFLQEFDPRSGSLRVVTRIASPLSPPTADRVEMVGVGFVDASVNETVVSRVTPLAGVVVSRNRREVMLVVAGVVAQRWPLELETPVEYTLLIDPLGRIQLSSDPAFVSADVPFVVSSTLRAIAYGRTANPADSTPPARVLDVRVTPSVCDMPAALERTRVTVVPAPDEDQSWADAHVAIGEPDLLRYVDAGGTEVVRMALTVDGRIYLARPDLGGFVRENAMGDPVLAPTEAWATDGVSDPALAFDDAGLHLYFTGWQDGRGTIGHALYDETASRFDVDGPVQGLEATGSIGYSAAAPFDVDGGRHLVLRVDEAGTHRLDVFSLDGPALLVTSSVRAPRDMDVFAYDRDEVDAPVVRLVNRVYRMYFSGRRGTRWSIGLLVSDDGLSWHEPSGDAVLAPSGRGFDALGVRDPALDVVDGTLQLYHAGDDGERLRIGSAGPR